MGELRSVRLNELGQRIREARTDAGLTGAQLATRAGITQPTISKIETGHMLPADEVFGRIANALGLGAASRGELEGLRSRAMDELARRRGQTRGVASLLALAEREHEASALRGFQNSIVPPLLQTAEYTRLLLRAARWLDDSDAGRAAAIQVERQSVLYEADREFAFILAEAALRTWHGDPAVMLAQLDRLAVVSTLDSVRLGILPHDAASHPLLHGFTLYDRSAVSIDTHTGAMMVTDREDVTIYYDMFTGYEKSACYGEEADRMIREATWLYRGRLTR